MDRTAAPTAGAPPRRAAWRRFLAGLLGAALPFGLAGFLVATTPGLKALVGLAELIAGDRLHVEGVQGRLLGPLRFAAIRYADSDWRVEVRALALEWMLRSGSLAITRLHAAGVDVASRPRGEPTRLPADLALPLALAVDRAAVDRLRLLLWPARTTDAPVAVLEIGELGARLSSDGRRHTLDELRFDTPFGRVSGALRLDGAAPFPLTGTLALSGRRDGQDYRVDAELAGPLAGFVVDAQARGAKLSGSARLEATPLAAVPFRAVSIALGEIDPAAFAPGAPHAALSLKAELAPLATAAPRQSPEQWQLAGRLEIANRLPAPLDRGGLPIAGLTARANWRAGELALDDLQLALPGQAAGQAGGRASLKGQAAHVELRVAGIDPRAVVSTLKSTRLSGDLTADASAAEQTVDAKLRETAPPPGRAGWRAGWQGELVASHRDQRVDIKSARLAAGDALFEAAGRLNLAADRDFALTGRMANFDPALYADLPHARLNAEIEARGRLRPQPLAKVRFGLGDSRLMTPDGPRELSGHGDVDLAPGRLARADLSLDLAGNRISAKGAYGLAGDALQVVIAAPRLAALGNGLGGRLDAELRLAGTPQSPSGTVTANAAALRVPGGIGVDSLSLAGQLLDGIDGRFDGKLDAAGVRRGAGGPSVDSVALTLQGTRGAHRLHARAELGADTRVELAAAGALAAGPEWRGSLERFALRGRPADLTLLAPAALAVSGTQASLGAAELKSGPTRIRLRETQWSPAGWQARGDLGGLPVGLALDAQQRVVAGGGSLTLGASWDLRADEHLNGRLKLVREAGDLSIVGDAPVSLGLSALSLEVTADDDRLHATLAAIGERLGQLDASASALAQRSGAGWALARGAPLAAAAQFATPSLAWLGPLLDPNLQVDGVVGGEIELSGTPAQPAAKGALHAFKVDVALLDQGLRLADGEIRVDFTQDRARLSAFSFRAEPRQRPGDKRISLSGLGRTPGRLSGSGEIELAGGTGTITLVADKLAVLQRADRWLMLSGEARLNTAWDSVGISGRLRADAAYFELAKSPPPSLADDVIVLGRTAPARKPLRLDVDLDLGLGDLCFFKGRGLDTRLSGAVRLRAENRGGLRASGSIAAEDGTFDAYGQFLSIERGLINFQGPVDNAGLNVVALRKGLPVEAGVEVTGSVLAPRVRLVSTPAVPDAEKLSWIVLGRGQDQTGAADSALLLAAATAILGGPGGGISRQLANGLGLEQLSVGSGEISGGGRVATSTVGGTSFGSREAPLTAQIVTLGKRLSAQTYLSYEQSLAGATRAVKLTHTLSRSLSLVGRAGTENSLDLLYSFSFD